MFRIMAIYPRLSFYEWLSALFYHILTLKITHFVCMFSVVFVGCEPMCSSAVVIRNNAAMGRKRVPTHHSSQLLLMFDCAEGSYDQPAS